MRARHAGVIGVTAGALLVLAAYGAARLAGPSSPAGGWLMISGVSLMMGAVFLLPSSGRGRRETALGVGLLLSAVFGASFLMPPDRAGDPLLGGFPLRVGLIVYGIAILPALILPALHARLFDSRGLDPESLARFREECRTLRGER